MTQLKLIKKDAFRRKFKSCSDAVYNLYRCSCGNEKLILRYCVEKGKTKTCGCRTNIQTGKWGGKSTSPEYNSWHNMKERCDNPLYECYERYGGRGITYCEQWKDFLVFLQDMGSRPKGTTLDRIDNDKGYYKENCRWADDFQQHSNKRNNISFNGVCASQRSRELGGGINLVTGRLKLGWTLEEAFSIPFLSKGGRKNRL